MERKPAEYVQFKLRVRQSLVTKLQKEAAKKRQSANNEAVERLEASFSKEAQQARDTAVVDMLADRDSLKRRHLHEFVAWLSKTKDSDLLFAPFDAAKALQGITDSDLPFDAAKATIQGVQRTIGAEGLDLFRRTIGSEAPDLVRRTIGSDAPDRVRAPRRLQKPKPGDET